MSKDDKPTSRMARHAAKQTRAQRSNAKQTTPPPHNTKPISAVHDQPRQSFITRHRWSLIIIVVLIVAFGVYAEFSSIANDNQAAEPTTAVASESSSAVASSSEATSHKAKSSSSTTDSSDTTTDSNSTDSSSADSSADSSAGGDGKTFSSTSEAVAWGRANASTWMAEGYSNFTVSPNGDGSYTIEYTK